MSASAYINRIQPVYVIGFYAIVYLCLLPYYQYQINPDAVSYIACAQWYAEGNIAEAVNGYWSPLLSWLLIPFVKMSIEPLMGIKLLNLCFSCLALYVLSLFAKTHISTPIYRLSLLLACIPNLLVFSLTAATPDIASMAMVLAFLYSITGLIAEPKPGKAIVTALMGTLTYFAKYYNFYAVLLALGIAAVYLLFSKKGKALIILSLSALAFVLLSGLWIWAIYHKYDVFTPTIASAFNTSLMGQPAPRYPFLSGDWLSLNYDQYRYTSWEDPFFYHLPHWSPFDSTRDFIFHIRKNVLTNIHIFIRYYRFEGVLAIAVSILLLARYRAIAPGLKMIFWTAALYPFGYLFTILEPRYIFFSIALVLLLFFALIDSYPLAQKRALGIAGCIILLAGFALYPMVRLPRANRYHELFTHTTGMDKPNVISSGNGTWAPALYLCYFNNGKLYDSLKPERVDSAFIASHPELDFYVCGKGQIPEKLRNIDGIKYIEWYAIVPLHTGQKPPFSQSKNSRVSSK